MSANYKYGVGLRNVGSYQVSGHPYLTGTTDMGSAGTEHKISFPYITKNVTVINSSSYGNTNESTIKVHFNSDSDPGAVLNAAHFITLDSEEDSITFDVKCKEIYITNVTANAAFQIYASLTNIEPHHMYALTGSGLTDLS
jgi:hypothetical protein|tara:strand:- start:394 stop:816 length:423 start_codon:yes stop_codon:yes gene_type:complete